MMLHIPQAPLSKANIGTYGGAALGLTPGRRYRLCRHPAALAKAVASFNNLPILLRHLAADERCVGVTGSDARFAYPYLLNSLIIWDQAAIEAIRRVERRELSAAYLFDSSLQPGCVHGHADDGVMRNIEGRHIALVRYGRAGSDVALPSVDYTRMVHAMDREAVR